MSRTIRKQLIEILDTLQKANELLVKVIEGASDEDTVGLLADCQNCAITMGNKIEAVYGTGTETVHTLEAYCETLFQISGQLHDMPECLKLHEIAKEQLLLAGVCMEKEIPDKKEVVFMPYKASMWDSLESVYLAAKKDPECEAYCVPIPYFDKNPDGSFQEMHYEGKEYPSNIEITDWESYDFENRMPDVIYIHNPYDECNYVTSVHPRFYAKNLKQYTEKLVYIPYFVLSEIKPDNQAQIDGMKHFCFLPGTIYADQVIVQSEDMRQIYINEYLKAAKEAGMPVERKQLEEKILGLGSPKFDKVLNTRKEDLEIPEEWLKIIEKPDGSWKKIIFYNTSINALLANDERMLEKMKDVFRIFKERKDEIALLWRPHPLIQTTIQSMRPRLWDAYQEIVAQYREEDWGIYDDTADMDRAVILSDAYYGDRSSVVQLYQKTGKPVMIQNVMILLWSDVEKLDNFFSVNGAYTNGKQFWLPSNQVNMLHYLGDKNTSKLSYLGNFGKIIDGRSVQIRKVIEEAEQLYFFSRWTYQIWILNIKTNIMKNISYSTVACADIANIEKIGKEVWIIPRAISDSIKIINLNKEKVIGELKWEVFFKKGCGDKGFTRSVVYNGYIYMAMWGEGKLNILEINSDNREMKIYTYFEAKYVSCINVDHRGIWILYYTNENRSMLVCIDKNTGEEKFCIELVKACRWAEDYELTYSQLILFREQVYLIPYEAENIILYDMEKGMEKIILCPNEYDIHIDKKIKFFEGFLHEEKIYLFPLYYNQVYVLNLEAGKVSCETQICIDEEFMREYSKSISDGGVLYETNINVKKLIEVMKYIG